MQARPAHLLAGQLVKWMSTSNRQNSIIQGILRELKSRKHPHHKQFANHVFSQLQINSPELHESVEDFITLGNLSQDISSESQIISIFFGYKQYWEGVNQKQAQKYLIKNFFDVHEGVCEEVAKFLQKPFLKKDEKQQKYQKYATELIWTQIQNCPTISEKLARKCLAFIYYLNLVNLFKVEEILEFVLKVDTKKYYYFFYDFQTKEINHQLVEAYINAMVKKDISFVKTLMKKIKINPFNFESYINILNKNCIRFLLKDQPLDFIEVKLNHSPKLIENLVEVLLETHRVKDVEYFTTKYDLNSFPEFYNSCLLMRENKIEAKDSFEPTEHFFYENCEKKYLTLKQLKYKYSDLKVIDSQSISVTQLNNIFTAKNIGIDCEDSFTTNGHEERNTVVFQLAASDSIYIFDLISLKKSKLFKEWLKKFFKEFKGNVIGHTTSGDIKDLLGVFDLSGLQERPLMIDIVNIYKQKFPQESKRSLKHITSHILKRQISKFQQCSSWAIRPLREAQLHYAGLDAVLPLKLYEMLQK